MNKKIIIGSDPVGFPLKEKVKEYLISIGYKVEDVGTLDEDNEVDYFVVGSNVGRVISDGTYDRGILFCGSGMGVSIVANKYPGVYCGVCESITSAEFCRKINNCNVLSMGALLITEYEAQQMVDTFLHIEFAKDFPLADPEYLVFALDEIQRIEESLYHNK